jgi:epoxyqueuosine reductase
MEKIVNKLNLSLKEELIEYAKSLGFNDLGIAKVDLLSTEIENYKFWLHNGFNANMQWMEKNIDKREDISLILDNAKSVIVTAHSYYTGYNYPPKNELTGKSGKISRYAWGNDYHNIILVKLISIENYLLSKFPDKKFKSYTDTGPILEKQWAKRAGIGWQGKNSLIISKELGSYFFIGVIISTLELEPDLPVKDYCGTCKKCIDFCPTSAIIDDKKIDSNKCISYWTVESKPGIEIPENISINQKNWIYGCDICQEVCPWNNNKPILTSELSFFPKNDETIIDYSVINSMTEEEFSQRFRNSPIKRTKLTGLKRNIFKSC